MSTPATQPTRCKQLLGIFREVAVALALIGAQRFAVLETASHQPDDRVRGEMEWVYTTTADAPAGHAIEVQAAAYDLAGNKIEQASAA